MIHDLAKICSSVYPQEKNQIFFMHRYFGITFLNGPVEPATGSLSIVILRLGGCNLLAFQWSISYFCNDQRMMR